MTQQPLRINITAEELRAQMQGAPIFAASDAITEQLEPVTPGQQDAPYAGTCCLIDFDGTLANSLVWYNQAIDRMFMGKVTDRPYIEHYKDFGDAYEIIPGSPWKSILMNLCRYLAGQHIVESTPVWDEQSVASSSVSTDIGRIDSMMLIAYGASFAAYDPLENVAIYESDSARYYAVLDQCASARSILFANEDCTHSGKQEFFIFVPSGLVALTKDQHASFDEAFIYVDDIADRIESIFNEYACEVLSHATYEDLAIDPVIRFCRAYKAGGGTIAIHSGSNRSILETMMATLGIEDLFDGYLCSDMLDDVDVNSLGAWGYKTELIGRLLSRYADRGLATFVVGDTKGDAFGAYENGQPLMLVWRGYPSDPTRLSSSEGTLLITDLVDARQDEVVAAALAGDEDAMVAAAEVKASLLGFAKRVGRGAVSPVAKEAD